MPDDADSKSNKYDSRITQSIDDLRSNGKWALVAFGAIGTTLLAGSQLSNIGKFSYNDPRLLVALVCGGLALLAASAAVRATLKVANTGYTELSKLCDADKEFLQENPALLEGFGTVDNVMNWYNFAIEQRFEALTQDPVNADDLEISQAWFGYLDGVVDNVASYLRYDRIKRQAEASRATLIDATFVAGLAIFGFVWAANPKSEQATVVLQSPASVAALKLTDQGKIVVAPIIGAKCAGLDKIDVIVLSVATTGSDLVTLKTVDCPLVRFTVTDALGKLSAL